MSVRELTAAAAGGVAVLEVRGAEATAVLARLCGELPSAGRLRLVRPVHRGEVLDEALLVARGPWHHELHLHGSPPLVRELRDLIGGGAAERATASRPRQRDLARRELPRARSEPAARMLLDQTEGALARELTVLEGLPAAQRDARSAELLGRGRAGLALLQPPRLVLVGPTNAGKSTLFNALVGQDRALVSEEAGTTRDALHALVSLGEWTYELVDTAGERAVASGEQAAVEAAGQALARQLALGARRVLRLWPADGEHGPPGPPAPGELGLWSRSDLAPGRPAPPGWLAISAGVDPRAAREALDGALRRGLDLPARAWEPGRGVPLGARALGWLEALRGERDPVRAARLLALLRAWDREGDEG